MRASRFTTMKRFVTTLWLLIAMPAFAQQAITTVTVNGTVRDVMGAPVAATVTIVNVDRNQRQSTACDARGHFRFTALPPGDYEVAVDAPGFAPARRAVRLALGATLDLPLQLQVAQSASIDVIAAAPLVEAERTQVVSSIAPEEVRDLPLNGRNYLDLALLAPGVSRTNTGANQRFAETSAVPGTGISVSTQRNLANSFIVDGLSANDDAAELAGTFFSQEVIRELAVVRAGGIAEFGRASAGIVNIATQSGTNDWRGNIYAFVRNDALDADNAITGAKLPLDQKQFGGSASGPLIADRTFVFANVEALRQEGGGVITIGDANAAAINARLDQIGYRGPRVTTGAFDATLDTTNTFLRADHQISSADQLTLRLNTYDVASSNARTVGGLNAESRGTSLENRDRTLAASNLRVLGHDAMSETRAQITSSRLAAPPNDEVGPAISISGIANLGTATNSPTARDIDLYQVVQNASLLRGNHSFKVGVDVLQNRVRIGFPGAVQGTYAFSSLGNFLDGRYSTFTQAFGEPDTHQTNTNFAAFVQDEWRAGEKLTINAGLRYDVQNLPSLVNTDRNNLSPRLGIAWGDSHRVVRLAAGTYYAPIPLRAVSNALQRDGVTYRIVQLAPTAAGAPTFPNVLPTYPANVLTNITTIDPDIRNSRSDQLTLQYEQQLATRLSASVALEHLRGRDIIMSRTVGDPTRGKNTQFQSIGDSWYDGLTVAMNGRPSSWSTLRVSYTFSKGLDTSGNFFFSQPQDANDIDAERGRSDNDQRHRLSLSGTATKRGWLFSYVFTYASALPFNIQIPTDRNGDTNFNDRPAGVGRNTGDGFDSQSLDLRVSRTFGIVEAIVDVFNALNRANYQVPNNIVTSPTFGRATAVNDPRQVQLGLRVRF